MVPSSHDGIRIKNVAIEKKKRVTESNRRPKKLGLVLKIADRRRRRVQCVFSFQVPPTNGCVIRLFCLIDQLFASLLSPG